MLRRLQISSYLRSNGGVMVAFLYILSVSLLLSANYFLQIWQEQNRIFLDQINDLVAMSKKEEFRNLAMENILKRYIEKSLRDNIFNELENNLIEYFYPEHKHDFNLRYDFKRNIEDKIRKNITETIKLTINKNLEKIIKDSISQKINDKVRTNLCSKDKKLPPNQKIIAYTVFGTRELYYRGIPIVLNQIVASNLYHDWRVRIYHDASLTPEVIAQYKNFKNVDFCDARKLPRYGDLSSVLGTFWRNVPMADESVDVVCFRDLDSALLTREEDAVREFMKSDKMFHLMHDHPGHGDPILAGMWGVKNTVNRTFARTLFENLLKQSKSYSRTIDQPLLAKVIFNGIVDKEKYMMQHNAYGCMKKKGTIPFPTQRKDNKEFIGCQSHGGCNWMLKECPVQCRPPNHADWKYC